MSKAKKLSADAKARNSLRGLDRVGWTTCVDDYFNGDAPLPPVLTAAGAGGVVFFQKQNLFNLVIRGREEKEAVKGPVREWYEHPNPEGLRREFNPCWVAEYVRVMYARTELLEDLATVIPPPRYLALPVFPTGGPSRGRTGKIPVWPAAAVFAIMARLWPEVEAYRGAGDDRVPIAWKWQEMTSRYLRGFTAQAATELDWERNTKASGQSELNVTEDEAGSV